MKTRKSLLLAVLIFCMIAILLVSCNENPAETTPAQTTTGADATTTAPVTTTAPSAGGDTTGQDLMKFPNKTFTYNGISRKATVTGIPQYLKVTYTYKDSAGNVIGNDEAVNAGTYTVTATFSFTNASYGDTYALPEPMTATLTIEKVETSKLTGFDMVDYTGYYYEDCKHTTELSGKLPKGLEVTYSMKKVLNADGTAANVNVTASQDGKFYATESGVYEMTASFIDAGNNYDAPVPSKTCKITVTTCPKQILNFTPTMDGQLDPAYLLSAHYETMLDSELPELEEGETMPEEYLPSNVCILASGYTSDATFGAKGDIYMLWDGDYVYLCAVIVDPTDAYRGAAYENYPNPWLNDGLEVYYFFGGYAKPVLPTSGDTYPTYKAVAITSKGGNMKHTAIDTQRSAYYAQIQSATSYTADGNGGGTYIIEYKFPAKSETYEGAGEAYRPIEGEAIQAGEFAFVGIQINDLTGVPEGGHPTLPAEQKYTNALDMSSMTEAWTAVESQYYSIMAVRQNRNRNMEGYFMVLQFSDETPDINVSATVDGEKDASYDNFGKEIAFNSANVLPSGTANNTVTGNIVWDGTYIYLFADVKDATQSDTDSITFTLSCGAANTTFTIANDAAGTVSGDGAANVVEKFVKKGTDGNFSVELKVKATADFTAAGTALTAGTVSVSMLNTDTDGATTLIVGSATTKTDFILFPVSAAE